MKHKNVDIKIKINKKNRSEELISDFFYYIITLDLFKFNGC